MYMPLIMHIYPHEDIKSQQRISDYRISSIVWYCVPGNVSSYLLELFILTPACYGRRSLRSASKGHFLVYTCSHCHQAEKGFIECGSLCLEWSSLPRYLSISFYKLLKTLLFGRAWAESASE